MEFKMDHQNFNVADLDKSIAFYEEAWGCTRCVGTRRRTGPTKSSTWATRSPTSSWS